MKLYLQNIIENISFESLPVKWHNFDFSHFSTKKTLFDFQQEALKNVLKALHLYYKDHNADKKSLFQYYKFNGLEEDFDYDLKKKQDSKTAKFLQEYPYDYPVVDNKISFAHFINRMSFWMATGSGKTLVIVKLIELLGELIAEKELPDGDIFFLTHRDDLIEQFKKHVEEFNNFRYDARINLKSLKDYESVKRESLLPFTKREITVFYYRSDLISDEHKEKIVNFKNYDNSGKQYVLLDEAHKGDREDSKRQILYSILSRNGFLFNFSATFTDPRDFATCAFSFNLSKFVEEGYGKHIYISQTDISAFRDKNDFSTVQKQKIILKTLVLLTYITKYFERIRQIERKLYHRPLLLTLVNSVDVEQSDLELFFKELENIAENPVNTDLLSNAKQELIQEFTANSKFEFEDCDCKIDSNLVLKLTYEDILNYVFNANTPGRIEVLKIPGNKQELIFKLKTAEKPFALIKIGDISDWLKNKLDGYEIIERFDNESYFKAINRDDSDINILMGSRSFYEGWDSNRPNIVLFINIGVGNDAKKFTLQSIGRGVRIEPLPHQRKRLQNLLNSKIISEELFANLQDLILPVESLFVFGTNAQNLREIIATLKAEKQEKNLGNELFINPIADELPLFAPVYKTSKKLFAEEQTPQRYLISKDDLALTSKFYNYLGDKITLLKYDCEPQILKKLKESLKPANQQRYYDFNTKNSILEPELTLERVLKFFEVKGKELEKFKKLENEIVHFKKLSFTNGEENYNEIRNRLELLKNKPEHEKKLDELFKKGDRSEYDKQLKLLEKAGEYEIKNKKIKIKYFANHYYLPLIVSEEEKMDYLNHIIKVKSESEFIRQLEEYLGRADNLFNRFDRWLFSKIDQTLDEIFIPYYEPKENRIAHFKPDFIFWAIKGREYYIIFVDPKGTEHADAYRKIDGYSRIFEDNKRCKEFQHNGFSVKVKLLLKASRGIASVPAEYKKYWFDNFDDFAQKIFS